MRAWLLLSVLLLAACNGPANSPYPAGQAGRNILYSAFSERPKHLDPARSYSENEVVFTGQIYEPPLQYHYLKRPYQLEPLTAAAMPEVSYYAADGRRLPESAPSAAIAYSVYEIRIKPGIHYQPHPAFAQKPDGTPRYVPIDPRELERIERFADFVETGSRELVAADYVYQIKRLANPRLSSPIFGLMAEYIVGLKEYGATLAKVVAGMPREAYLDLERYPLAGVELVDRYTYRVKIKGKYPQFAYWLAMPFFAPVPAEAERFYNQPGMLERNFSLDWQPVGTGPFYLAENDPNRVMRLKRNPHYHDDFYPAEGEPGDRAEGLLMDAGRRLPLLDEAVYRLEKEDIPYWTKFLQGYYDTSGISSDTFDQAIRMGPDGQPDLSPEMRERGIELSTAVRTSIWYVGFNMRDPVLGGLGESARKLRQAISIALDYEEFISIFLNGRGIPAQGPLPPGIYGYRAGEAGINPVVYRWQGGQPVRRGIEEARRLLAEAGYPNGREAATGRPLTLYLDTMASGPEAKARLDWYRKQFEKLGVQLVVRSTDYNRFQDKMLKGNAQIFEWGWNADYPDPENFLFLLYGPNRKMELNGENAANYENPEFDRLFLQMKDMANGPARQALIERMVEIVRHDAPWVFAYFPKTFGLRHAWVKNGKPNLMANNTLKYRRVEPERRVAYQAKWNRAVWWPLLGLFLLLVMAALPALRAYRRRQQAAANTSY
ncbi:ABC-type transport system substrate-binding protein [Sulfuritortus calidifontis]|uniref:ABC-type transport system substrate-binding protein n=1 Tax=Sulfuritortus calidifontis TaxID=1914471 RepID=A0A4R3JWL2_9PROT|nr:ABC transporter substrate-binding protein [Sulfuritortus calidifontis]TCS71535.1 ABC-type transport system substrate-binding protein [Sulfuritortus calidifontis]